MKRVHFTKSVRSCYPPKTLAFLTKKVTDDLNNYGLFVIRGLSLLYYFAGLAKNVSSGFTLYDLNQNVEFLL